eukprot:scaffold1632_cov208-Ochromonas_danica.AAC.2
MDSTEIPLAHCSIATSINIHAQTELRISALEAPGHGVCNNQHELVVFNKDRQSWLTKQVTELDQQNNGEDSEQSNSVSSTFTTN